MKIVIFLASSNATGSSSFLESLEIQAVGVAIVLVALGLLALLVAITERLLQQSQKKARQDIQVTPSPGLEAPSNSAQVSSQVPEEVWAVIAASIFHTMGSTHRVLHVEPVSNIQLQAWSVEGRRQIFQSHKLR